MGRRVVITGLGMQTSLGVNPHDFFDRLILGESGIRPHPALDAETAWLDFDAAAYFSPLQARSMGRVSQLAVAAARDAAEASAVAQEGAWPVRSGVFVGTGMGGMEAIEAYYEGHFAGRRPPLVVPNVIANAAASRVAIHLGVQGECHTFGSACAASATAIGEACRRIRDGYLDVAVAGGAEACLTPGVLAAWGALGAMSDEAAFPSGTSCRPFSKDRTGSVMGEGAVMFVLESLDGALSRGAIPLCEIVGYGLSADAHHIVNPDAAGQVRAMRAALQDAGLLVSDIGYVNAHGTGTWLGDATEAAAIVEVFGKRLEHVPVSSTKSAHGNLLGATAAIELAATIWALRRQILPPTTHWHEADPSCPFDCIPGVGRPVRGVEFAMSNSFGYGGSNVVLIVKAID